jgi:hypothetical protein
MSDVDALDDLEALVRERLRLATHDKFLFERDGQRLNSQLMQGEINMGTAVLGWITLRRQGIALADVEDDTDDNDPDA